MSDILSFVVRPIPDRYPTNNALGRDGFRGGRKSEAYKALATAIDDAAKAEIARVGWTTATYYCATELTIYRSTRTRIDAANLGKCELDAMTRAGVWLDDELAKPYGAETEYDPSAPSRLLVVVRRRYPSLLDVTAAQASAFVERVRSKRPKPASDHVADAGKMVGPQVGDPVLAGDPIAAGFAVVNGRLALHADVLAMLNDGKTQEKRHARGGRK